MGVFPATLFDFNGVLVDDELVHLAAFRDAVAPLGIAISETDYFDKYLGFDDAGAFEALLLEAGLPAPRAEVDRLIEAKRPLYMARAQQELKTFPGAADVIRARARSGPVGVVSGALTAEIEFGLEQLGVRPLVQKIISAEDTTVSKPDPEGYRLGQAWLLPLLGASAERALVVEDSLDGIRAAKAAGLPCVAVAHSYPLDALREAGADLAVERLDQVSEALLAELYGRLY